MLVKLDKSIHVKSIHAGDTCLKLVGCLIRLPDENQYMKFIGLEL